MHIPKKFSQFENYPTLFVVSGEYEALFYLAQNSTLKKVRELKLNPREEAKEKQGFVGKKGGMQDLSSVSHHERYLKELKKKFHHQLDFLTTNLRQTYSVREINLLAPKHGAQMILKNFSPANKKRLYFTIYGTHTKKTPVEILELFSQEISKMHEFAIHEHIPKTVVLKNGMR